MSHKNASLLYPLCYGEKWGKFKVCDTIAYSLSLDKIVTGIKKKIFAGVFYTVEFCFKIFGNHLGSTSV